MDHGVSRSTDSVTIVSGYLIGNGGTINIPATNEVFGDPCGGTGKRLYIQATASQTTSIIFTVKQDSEQSYFFG